MSQTRKTATARKKDFELAIYRIERGRAHTKATKINISTVAAEVGVRPSLIHNHYPEIAEKIRQKAGASALQQRNAKHQALKEEVAKNRGLRDDLKDAGRRIAQLASINETLLMRVAELEAIAASGNVKTLAVKTPQKC